MIISCWKRPRNSIFQMTYSFRKFSNNYSGRQPKWRVLFSTPPPPWSFFKTFFLAPLLLTELKICARSYVAVFIVFPVASTCTKQAFNVGMNFFWPFFKNKKEAEIFFKGMGVWLYGIKWLAYNDFAKKIAKNKSFCCLEKAVIIGKLFLMKFLLIFWFFFQQ